MDPALIESHTGMKVLTNEEFEKLTADLEETRQKIRDMNSQVQQKYSEVLKASLDIQNAKQEIEELKKQMAEN
jgi:methyl-accepting chemotaxis protein